MKYKNRSRIIAILISCIPVVLCFCTIKQTDKTKVFNNFNTFMMSPYNSKNECDSMKVVCDYNNGSLAKLKFITSADQLIFEDTVYNLNGKQFLVHKKDDKYICSYKHEMTVRILVFVVKDNLLFIKKIFQLKEGGTLERMIFDYKYKEVSYYSIGAFLKSDIISKLDIKEESRLGTYQYLSLKYDHCVFKYQWYQVDNFKDTSTSPPSLVHVPDIKSNTNCLYIDIMCNDLYWHKL